MRNTFTGEMQSCASNASLTAGELTAVRKVLKQAKACGPDEYGCYVLEQDDGGHAELFGSDLGNGCMVAVQTMSLDLSQLLFNLLKAGEWVMLPTGGDAGALAIAARKMRKIPDDFPRIAVCNSANELTSLLADSFRVWEKYRDQVVSEDE